MDQYPDIIHIQRSILQFDLDKCKLLADWLAEHIRNMEVDQELYKVDILHLNLSRRTLTILRANNILSVGQLLIKANNWDQIRILKGAGAKMINEIREKVDEIRKTTN